MHCNQDRVPDASNVARTMHGVHLLLSFACGYALLAQKQQEHAHAVKRYIAQHWRDACHHGESLPFDGQLLPSSRACSIHSIAAARIQSVVVVVVLAVVVVVLLIIVIVSSLTQAYHIPDPFLLNGNREFIVVVVLFFVVFHYLRYRGLDCLFGRLT